MGLGRHRKDIDLHIIDPHSLFTLTANKFTQSAGKFYGYAVMVMVMVMVIVY